MDITSIKKTALGKISASKNAEILEGVFKSYLGKSGELNSLLKTLGSLPSDQRKEAGQSLNLLKK